MDLPIQKKKKKLTFFKTPLTFEASNKTNQFHSRNHDHKSYSHATKQKERQSKLKNSQERVCQDEKHQPEGKCRWKTPFQRAGEKKASMTEKKPCKTPLLEI